MSNIDKIKAKIQALLNKARGTDNEAEADAFLSKAMQMLEAHQLDVSDVVEADDPILHHTGLTLAESGHAWRWKLYNGMAILYGCRSIHVEIGTQRPVTKRDKDGNPTQWGRPTRMFEQRVVGRQSAIVTLDLMYPWVVEQVRERAKALKASGGSYRIDDRGMRVPMDSEQGIAKRVAAALLARIARMISENEERLNGDGNAGALADDSARRRALAIMDQVSARYDELYGATEKIRTGGKAITDAACRDAAGSIGLHRQAGHETQLRLG